MIRGSSAGIALQFWGLSSLSHCATAVSRPQPPLRRNMAFVRRAPSAWPCRFVDGAVSQRREFRSDQFSSLRSDRSGSSHHHNRCRERGCSNSATNAALDDIVQSMPSHRRHRQVEGTRDAALRRNFESRVLLLTPRALETCNSNSLWAAAAASRKTISVHPIAALKLASLVCDELCRRVRIDTKNHAAAGLFAEAESSTVRRDSGGTRVDRDDGDDWSDIDGSADAHDTTHDHSSMEHQGDVGSTSVDACVKLFFNNLIESLVMPVVTPPPRPVAGLQDEWLGAAPSPAVARTIGGAIDETIRVVSVHLAASLGREAHGLLQRCSPRSTTTAHTSRRRDARRPSASTDVVVAPPIVGHWRTFGNVVQLIQLVNMGHAFGHSGGHSRSAGQQRSSSLRRLVGQSIGTAALVELLRAALGAVDDEAVCTAFLRGWHVSALATAVVRTCAFDASVAKFFVRAVPVCLRDCAELSGSQLSYVLAAYAAVGCHDARLFLALGQRAGDMGETLRDDDAARILHAFGRTGIDATGLRRSLESSMHMKQLHRRPLLAGGRRHSSDEI